MPTDSREGRAWSQPLAGRVADDASAEQVADAIVAIWQDIDQALHPIVGHRGVAALYNRSLGLAAAARPWLALGTQGPSAAVDLAALRAALVQQPAVEAAIAGSALFASLQGLLGSLVGPSLTERLLRAVWAPASNPPPAQDTLT